MTDPLPILPDQPKEPARRDFLFIATGTMAAVGVGAFAVPLFRSLAPDASQMALAFLEVDLSPIQLGQSVRFVFRGNALFIRRRTPQKLERERSIALANVKNPATDQSRVIAGKDEWLIIVGVCTHLSCVPIENRGDFGGWFCPCHGSHYDASSRIRKGPAPTNLIMPRFAFLSDTRVRVG